MENYLIILGYGYFLIADEPHTRSQIFHNWGNSISQMSTMYRCFGTRTGIVFLYDTSNKVESVFSNGFFTGEVSPNDSFRPVIIVENAKN